MSSTKTPQMSATFLSPRSLCRLPVTVKSLEIWGPKRYKKTCFFITLKVQVVAVSFGNI